MHPVVAQGEGSRGRGFLSPALKQNSGHPTNTDPRADGDTARQRQGGWRKTWQSDQWKEGENVEAQERGRSERDMGRRILETEGSVDYCEQG